MGQQKHDGGARENGPVAGLLVAATGPDVVYALNAVSFLGVLAALLGWHRARHGAGDRERMRPALANWPCPAGRGRAASPSTSWSSWAARASATLLWGLLADGIGTAETLLVSAGPLLAPAASLARLPLRERTGTLDRTIVAHWPEPAPVLPVDPDGGPVLFEVASWSEHLRQHGARLTGYDAELLTASRDLAEGEPEVRHLVPPAGEPARP
ncbi:MFS transporter [Streptomyces albidoflavus]|uniref:MFS transporter n=1 Tax=Streptomyces albidoflavus TaxID=1886 RepID=UPI001E31E552|nr:MFS transporter [Streptomyces albidoflavus]